MHTVEAWVWFPGNNSIDFRDKLTRSYGSVDQNLNFNGQRLRLYAPISGEPNDKITAATPVVPETWTHYALTRDADGNLRLYVNGELDATGVVPFTVPFRIGWIADTHLNAISKTDNFRIWTTARSAEEIAAFRDITILSGPPELARNYRFDDSATTIVDATGNSGNTPVPSGGAIEASDAPVSAVTPEPSVTPTSTTAYVYDIGALRDITAHDVLLEYQDGALARRWLHGQQIDEPVAYEGYTTDATAGAGTAYALHADRQGSVIAVTDQSTGTVAARYEYDAFGSRTLLSGAGLQDYGFTGREFDAETGLYYFRARHYDPEAGRFLQSDPLGFAAGDLNLYAYTWNDPANWTDPSGLAASADAATTTSGAAGLAASTYRVGSAALCLAGKVSTALTAIGDIVENGLDTTNITLLAAAAGSCRTKAKAPKSCGCSGGKRGLATLLAKVAGSLSSFPEGTEVLTPDGPVAIETLREGDLVLGRDEETGQSGVFPVTALMTRQALDTLWLTLEKDGETTRMGVTSQHPLFVAGEGWIVAGELVPGDAIRSGDLTTMSVLSVELDSTPTRVHNLEVAGAHTYFAGELEAWGHNARRAPEIEFGSCPINVGLDFMETFLGSEYVDLGDGRYRSQDGLRQARLGDHETRNPRNLHCHVEQLNKKGNVVVNFVIKLTGR